MTQNLVKNLNQIGGGGILLFAFLATIPLYLNAIELAQICTSGQQCKIENPQATITNHSHFTTGGSEGIYICTTIGTFTNYGDISVGSGNQAFIIKSGGYITHFINHGNIAQNNKMSFYVDGGKGISNLTNYGTMGGIEYNGSETMTINNFGLITHFQFTTEQERNLKTRNGGKIVIQNYALTISENATTFNGYKDGGNLSHLLIYGDVSFADSSAKMILDFGSGFELGKPYKLDKLIVDSQNGLNKLKVDFGQLTTRSDLFYLTQNGENFIAHLVDSKTAGYSAIGSLYKANVQTMNNFMILSNSMIYPRKYSKSQNLRNSSLRDLPTANRGNPLALSSLRASASERGNPHYENNVDSALDSAFSLKSYESFLYRNELQTRRIQRQNKRNYSRNLSNSQNLNVDSANRTRERQNQRFSQNLAQNPHDYYFILTPFINHNYFFESGRYNLSGFDYGFLTAFSARVAESNSLGAHFMMSYGSLSDSSDKDFHISNLNLNLGLNYKLDLIWDSYLKVRGDFFYFLNQVKTLTMREAIKPNNLGFGLSVSYGKDFDFKQGGVLGLEVGLDYKALQSNNIELHDNTYQKQLYNLLYADLGISYAKYFGGFGINANLGIKGNITANKLAKSKIILNNFNRSMDMILDSDKILGYANVALSYVLNARNFDMEFSLAYYGNFGDRIISNGGGFEWRVVF